MCILKISFQLFILLSIVFTSQSCKDNTPFPDVLIIGGGTSGVSAGIASARMGVQTMIIEESEWLGGMLTSAGVSAVDGNYRLPGGFWGELKDSLINYYGSAEALKTGWVSNVLFEPSAGNKILQQIVAKEKDLKIHFKSRLKSIIKEKEKWIVTIETPEKTIMLYPRIVIDATELGDVAFQCGVKYDVGMESREVTKEEIAPETANDVIQDLTYVAILKDYGKDVTIPIPEDYDPGWFACPCDNPSCSNPDPKNVLWSKEQMMLYGKLPNNKYMINWPIEGNDYYVNLIGKSEKEREEALEKAKKHTLRFVYFIQKELGMNTLGLADDEFPTSDKMPLIPYHRESLRIHGLVRFTLNHIVDPHTQAEKLYRTSIAVGDYPVDHHHGRYPEKETLPHLYFHSIPSYGLPLGVMIPQDVKGLIVAEKSISVSNIVNGTTRLQPVVLQIGQAAGVLAALSVKSGTDIDKVPVRDVQQVLLSQGGYLLPYLDVEKEHPLFLPLQRIGTTGILQGIGKNEGWSNETWFRADDPVLWSELGGMKEIYPYIEISDLATPVVLNDMLELIITIGDKEKLSYDRDILSIAKEIFTRFDLPGYEPNKQLTRAEAAVLIDSLLNPFEKDVDIKGYYIM
ncbi:MAG: FAD-dependent oxidoreductase [Proteiniphilum sp.]|uniref:FAD-dependent oxidoreductase n=1 Tax=Proteiniphilum sp. TaxID=1926877 RepID=UPI002ABC24CC|nr:FAD-dependent oxidoreductase [Proteiniphilum sp.]MDY9917614.1 FAD-dependent oxidoreductase [Proteiniphilum sp.]